MSREFEAALDQMRGNRRYIDLHEHQIRELLEPLLQPINFKHLPIFFEHVLIYGRSDEKNQGKERIAVIQEREKETGFRVLTYDSVIDAYQRGVRCRKNILRVAGKRFAFKKLVAPGGIFGFVKPADLQLSAAQLNQLREEGYQIDAWRDDGKLLNGDIYFKTVAKSIDQEVKDIMDTLMTHYLKPKT